MVARHRLQCTLGADPPPPAWVRPRRGPAAGGQGGVGGGGGREAAASAGDGDGAGGGAAVRMVLSSGGVTPGVAVSAVGFRWAARAGRAHARGGALLHDWLHGECDLKGLPCALRVHARPRALEERATARTRRVRLQHAFADRDV